MEEWVIREVIDTLYMAKSTLLGITGLDTPQEVEKKCRENESAITRRISRCIDLVEQTCKVDSPAADGIKVGDVVKCHQGPLAGKLAEVTDILATVKAGIVDFPFGRTRVVEMKIPPRYLSVDKEATEKLRKGGGVIER